MHYKMICNIVHFSPQRVLKTQFLKEWSFVVKTNWKPISGNGAGGALRSYRDD